VEISRLLSLIDYLFLAGAARRLTPEFTAEIRVSAVWRSAYLCKGVGIAVVTAWAHIIDHAA
jgi:hypothetical protein